jgi:hypothetical protein
MLYSRTLRLSLTFPSKAKAILEKRMILHWNYLSAVALPHPGLTPTTDLQKIFYPDPRIGFPSYDHYSNARSPNWPRPP